MMKNTRLRVLLIFPATIFGMENPGMQELAKHKTDFQAGMKKLLEKIPEDLSLDEYSPIRYEYEMQRNRAMRGAAKELEAAFNAIAENKAKEPLSQTALDQDADYSAIDKYINELKDVQYTYDLGTPGRIDRERKQRDMLVAGWQKITAELARSKEEYQSLANTLAQVRNQLQEKIRATYNLEAANSTAIQQIKSLEARLQEKEREIAHVRQQNSQASMQSQDSQKRIVSMLTLFESSKTTGWEAIFIEAIKEELKGQP